MSLSLKSAALAGAIVLASAGAAFASEHAFIDHDVLVHKHHANGSPIVNSADEGDYVKILGHWGNWYKIKLGGPDGWVRANALDFGGPGYGPGYPYGPGPHACVSGPYGYFCIN